MVQLIFIMSRGMMEELRIGLLYRRLRWKKLVHSCLQLHPRNHGSKHLPSNVICWWLEGDPIGVSQKMAYELVHNSLDVDGAITRSLISERPAKNLHHDYISIPPYSKWVNGKWKKVFAWDYQKMTLCNNVKWRHFQELKSASHVSSFSPFFVLIKTSKLII